MRKIILQFAFLTTSFLFLLCPFSYAEDMPASDTNAVSETSVTQITNTNTTDDQTTHSLAADTGANSLPDVVAPEVKQVTGDIAITDSVTTEVHTNAVGTDTTAGVIDVTSPDQTVDLSSPTPRPCLKPGSGLSAFLAANNITFDEFVNIINTNNANILNTISIDANTGKNSISGVADTMEIQTGDIDTTVNIATIANTNVVGDCNYFVIINIYADSNGDIILPYEFSANDAVGSASSTMMTNTNTADMVDTVTIDASTGSNSGKTIGTGDITVGVTNSTTANTNIVGDNWVRLSVNTFGTWTGVLLDWLTGVGEVAAAEHVQNNASTQITNQNTAQVTNDVSVSANTGGNSIQNENVLGGSKITTGDINVHVNTFNFVNNNLIGNNWWYAIINIFGNFSGNIRIARPDLYLLGSSSKKLLNSGDEATFTIRYLNHGLVNSTGNSLTTTIPDYLELIDFSEGGVLAGNRLSWKLNDCPIETECGSVWVRARLRYGDLITNGARALPFTIHTNMRETALSDNTFGVPFFAYIWTLDPQVENSTNIPTPNLPTIPNRQFAHPNLPKTTRSSGKLLPALFTNIPNHAPAPKVLGAMRKSNPIIPIHTRQSQLWLLGVLTGILLSRRVLFYLYF